MKTVLNRLRTYNSPHFKTFVNPCNPFCRNRCHKPEPLSMEPKHIHSPNNALNPIFPVQAAPDVTPPEIIFFYLGKSPSQGKLLIDSFHSGFFLQDISGALPLLQKTRNASVRPIIIIFNGILGKEKLQEFYTALPSDLKRDTAIFVDATRLEPSAQQGYSTLDFVNEIILLRDMKSERLQAIAEFIITIKTNNQKVQLESRNLPFFMRLIESREMAKRAVDIFLSALAIISLSPLFLIIAIAIMLESGGPVLSVSPREGRGYRIFNFFKFRTMVDSPEADAGQISHLHQYIGGTIKKAFFFKSTRDLRSTKVGAVLRSAGLDELPKLFNVLLGDISLVGNRAVALYEAETSPATNAQ